ncbi:hypothetical protein OHD62_05665 [Mesorhizobium sp. YC-39]|uniref:hypothetical protein n=1 Tax=unclassified Mesorhizobium TaxID=325217 RepID=UPI0021E8BCF4|nr:MULTISPECIES: hypothetical protein [unclassified Mesorhizobium]MCV3205745.1 hypothetical protein [Mesorhizobium sp. YC-2]MCV3227856.1 hypothetical protein [Mesorhizobium sp. YC-39]
MTIRLMVGKAATGDIGRDILRINHADRPHGISRHDIVSVEVNGRSAIVAIRGNDEPGVVNIDVDARDDLRVLPGETYEFELRRIWFGKLRWYWNATDPATRVPTHIAVVSFILGVIGLALGVLSVWS